MSHGLRREKSPRRGARRARGTLVASRAMPLTVRVVGVGDEPQERLHLRDRDLRQPETAHDLGDGVLVAGALPQIRIREFDATGAPAGAERIVTSPPTRGIEPGVAAYAPGWLVAYRALPDGTLTTPTIRIAFASRFGTPNAIFDVAATTQEGGPVTIATAPDGRVAVAWAERRTADVALYAARFVCD